MAYALTDPATRFHHARWAHCQRTGIDVGDRLSAHLAPGAFMGIGEADDPTAIERAVKNLDASGYTRYVDARWLIGERAADTTSRRNDDE